MYLGDLGSVRTLESECDELIPPGYGSREYKYEHPNVMLKCCYKYSVFWVQTRGTFHLNARMH